MPFRADPGQIGSSLGGFPRGLAPPARHALSGYVRIVLAYHSKPPVLAVHGARKNCSCLRLRHRLGGMSAERCFDCGAEIAAGDRCATCRRWPWPSDAELAETDASEQWWAGRAQHRAGAAVAGRGCQPSDVVSASRRVAGADMTRTERQRARRRAAGVAERGVYLAVTAERRAAARALRAAGLSQRTIAARLGVSLSEANRLLRTEPLPPIAT